MTHRVKVLHIPSTLECLLGVDAVRSLAPGDVIHYESYGEQKTGTVARIGKSGIIFLTTGRFVFPESVTG